jgi:hypothetical protein
VSYSPANKYFQVEPSCMICSAGLTTDLGSGYYTVRLERVGEDSGQPEVVHASVDVVVWASPGLQGWVDAAGEPSAGSESRWSGRVNPQSDELDQFRPGDKLVFLLFDPGPEATAVQASGPMCTAGGDCQCPFSSTPPPPAPPSAGRTCTLFRTCALTDVGARSSYVHREATCAWNANIVRLSGSTVAECQRLCDAYGDGCRGYEFFRNHGNSTPPPPVS